MTMIHDPMFVPGASCHRCLLVTPHGRLQERHFNRLFFFQELLISTIDNLVVWF